MPILSAFPADGSWSSKVELHVGDLITPDGDRVWIVEGWEDNGHIRAQTIENYVGGYPPPKSIPDDPARYAPLTHINKTGPRLVSGIQIKQRFLLDYFACSKKTGAQKYLIGLEKAEHLTWYDYEGKKVYPYGTAREHVIRDHNRAFRYITVEDREGDLKDIDLLEFTASWNFPNGVDILADDGPMVVSDLIESGQCSGACMVSAPKTAKSCTCRCRGLYHGALADSIVSPIR